MRVRSFCLFLILSSLISCMRETKSLKTYELPEKRTHQNRRPPKGTVPLKNSVDPEKQNRLSGKELYQIHCQVCHGPKGKGEHQLRKYGLPQPPSFHLQTVKQKPLKFFTRIIKEGRGAMVSYKGRLNAKERKRVAKYIKSLQQQEGEEQ